MSIRNSRPVLFLTAALQNPLGVFLVLIMVFGLSATFLQPPMAVNDEISHFSRAYEVSHGHLLSKRYPNGIVGGEVPNIFTDLDGINTYRGYQKPDPALLKAGIERAKPISINQERLVQISYSNTALYSALSYLPQAIVIKAGSLLDASVITTFYATRLVVLLLFAALVALAIRITPYKKWFFALIGLLPMSVQQAASVSIDAFVIAFCLLFMACFLHVYATGKFAYKLKHRAMSLLPIMFFCVLYVSLAKFVYFPLFLTMFFLPRSAFQPAAQRLRTIGLVLFIPLLLVIAWNAAVSSRGVHEAQRLAVNSVGIYPLDTVDGLKKLVQPAFTAELLLHTYVDQQTAGHDIPNYITEGFFGKFTSYYIATPTWYVITVGLSLLLAGFMTVRKRLTFGPRLRLLTLAALFIAWTGITFSMFFYTTNKDANFINGVQGRYFIPLIIFTLLLAGRRPLAAVADSTKTRALLVGLIIFNLLYMQTALLQWFWHA